MKRCHLFIENDTGTMPHGAAVGCSASPFFPTERPGLWYHRVKGTRVFRSAIECEGCGLVECLELGNECLKRISVKEVLHSMSRKCWSGRSVRYRLKVKQLSVGNEIAESMSQEQEPRATTRLHDNEIPGPQDHGTTRPQTTGQQDEDSYLLSVISYRGVSAAE